MPGRILVRLLILEAEAGMLLSLPSPRALDSDMTFVVLAVAVLTVFPEGKKYGNTKTPEELMRNTLCDAV